MLRRVILAYLVVPLVPPVLMLVWSGAWRMRFGDWLGILLLYEVIGLLAMIVLGVPLLLLYKWRGWTGWGAFMLAGGACAALTSAMFLFTSRNLAQVPFFTTLGIVAGVVFRLVLYGASSSPRSANPRSAE